MTDDRYRVLIAEVLLQQTNVNKALPAYERIVAAWPTPDDLARADDSLLTEIIRPLGFGYRSKRIKDLALALVKVHSGKVPADISKLLKLPGVGVYTASAVLSFTTRKRIPVIDAPVSRVLGRILGLPIIAPGGHPPRAVREAASILVESGNPRLLNWALMDLSAKVCTFQKPRCSECPLAPWCVYFRTADKSRIR